jgi:hypothetical protein
MTLKGLGLKPLPEQIEAKRLPVDPCVSVHLPTRLLISDRDRIYRIIYYIYQALHLLFLLPHLRTAQWIDSPSSVSNFCW